VLARAFVLARNHTAQLQQWSASGKAFPERFGSLQDARAFVQEFFAWYNEEHRHSGTGCLPPSCFIMVWPRRHRATAGHSLTAAYASHPARFVGGPPQPPDVPKEVWINKPHRR
jgi:putative transposase